MMLTDSSALARPFLAQIFSDNMVLQRDRENPIWGWATPGAEVTVTFAGVTSTAVADAGGKWSATLVPLPSGGPYEMLIATAGSSVALTSILIGDVWICSGQSNMEMGVSMVDRAEEEVAGADHANLRLFTVDRAWGQEPLDTIVTQQWQVCSPETIVQRGWGGFSAVGYFFGRKLHQELGVPIGLINTSWGGTAGESWVSGPALGRIPDFADVAERVKYLDGLGELIAKQSEAWCDTHDGDYLSVSLGRDAESWQTTELPGPWVSAGVLKEYVGVVWYQREFDLGPQHAGASDATLRLGRISETDTVWINGARVGIGAGRETSRVYDVPSAALRAGSNTIAIRVLNLYPWSGGIDGDPASMRLDLADGKSVQLSGSWRYKATTALNDAGEQPPRDEATQASLTPSSLFNGMVAPLIPFGIAGAVWYQGETNVGRARQYRTLLASLIADWRARWNCGDFPFYIVSLSNWIDGPDYPNHSKWADLRESQAFVAHSTQNSGLVVTADIGDAHDIHPKNKQDVGLRLALCALAGHYGRTVESSGPVFETLEREGDKVRLSFRHAEGGLVGPPPQPSPCQGEGAPETSPQPSPWKGEGVGGFAVAGDDRQFVRAQAVVEGDSVVVWSPDVAEPVAVRYAWANNPECPLFNIAGLPAVPFRTDNWDAG